MKNTLYSVSFILTCLGALQWGIVGIGGFFGKNFNIIAILTKGNTMIEYGIYTLVGLAGLLYIWFSV
jgi:uncharacterized membrane protein YuzA (DUF378 family)